MATFPSIKPTYGIRKRSRPLTRTIRFADGYEHRLLFGLAQHQNPKEFSLTYEVSETDADTIETFLDARANDSDSFDFAEGFLPEETASNFKFVCDLFSCGHYRIWKTLLYFCQKLSIWQWPTL